jgi:hypothetical protein
MLQNIKTLHAHKHNTFKQALYDGMFLTKLRTSTINNLPQMHPDQKTGGGCNFPWLLELNHPL